MNDTPPQSLPPGTTDLGRVEEYVGAGNRSLRYRVLASNAPQFRLAFLHGIESHGTWFLPAATALAQHGCTTYLLDRRGSGLNGDLARGDTPSAEVLIDDVRLFRQRLGDAPVHLAALSWGGKLALAAALDRPRDWAGVTLITPGLRAKVTLPLRHKLKVALGMLVGGRCTVPVPLRPELFTSTPVYQNFIRDDPWRVMRVTARFCLATRDLDRRIVRPDVPLASPLLVVLAERDRIIDNDGVTDIARRVQPRAAIAMFADAEHTIQFERLPALVEQIVRHIKGDHVHAQGHHH